MFYVYSFFGKPFKIPSHVRKKDEHLHVYWHCINIFSEYFSRSCWSRNLENLSHDGTECGGSCNMILMSKLNCYMTVHEMFVRTCYCSTCNRGNDIRYHNQYRVYQTCYSYDTIWVVCLILSLLAAFTNSLLSNICITTVMRFSKLLLI